MTRHRAARLQLRRRGLALALVTIHSVLILSAWALANRQTVDLVRFKQFASDQERQHEQETRREAARRLALGYALALLETEVPPSNPYPCMVDIDSNTASTTDAVLTFQLTFAAAEPTEPNRWTINVQDAAPRAQGPRPWRFEPAPEAEPPPDGS
jgi:hypothetical protein